MLQWRAGQLSGQASGRPAARVSIRPLQWRAGQLSGQARRHNGRDARDTVASMEGRTIVRPGQRRPRRPAFRARRFNGGPDNCPARPSESRHHYRKKSRFNGGPDNCPARLQLLCGHCNRTKGLQWRAGQLSGQALIRPWTLTAINSLQWRAGQLSGQARFSRSPLHQHHHSFNGGPDNCPARPLI